MNKMDCKACDISDVNCYFQCLPVYHPCHMCGFGRGVPLECVRCNKPKKRNEFIEKMARQKEREGKGNAK